MLFEVREVAQELIEKTKNNELEWKIDHDNKLWCVEHGNCSFSVYSSAHMIVYVSVFVAAADVNISAGFDDTQTIEPLTSLLQGMYPFGAPFNSDNVLEAALECLTK